MARVAAAERHGVPSRFNPFFACFRLLTSVWFAAANLTLLAFAALVGVLFPQMPGFVNSDPSRRQEWLDNRRYAGFGPALERVDAFDTFHAPWFYALVGVLVLSVAVCTVSRLRPIWRSIRTPQIAPGDAMFADSAEVHPCDVDGESTLVAALRRKHYAVRIERRTRATYIYADRFAWARLATFATHLSLLMFLIGGILTWLASDSVDLLVAQGFSEPVFAPGSAHHMEVRVIDFVHRQDAAGHDMDIHSDLAVFRDGTEVAHGRVTINSPLHYGGYTFHQAAYSETGAALHITDAATGAVLYSRVLNLFGELPAPRVRISDASGAAVFDDVVPPTFFPDEHTGATAVSLADGRTAYIAVRQDAPGKAATGIVAAAPDGDVTDATAEAPGFAGGLTFILESMETSHYVLAPDVPGSAGLTLVQMVSQADGATVLLVSDTAGQTARLAAGTTAAWNGMRISFGGEVPFSGITVKRDPGARWIWIAVALLLIGLALTFYVPRRRLWLRLRGGEITAASRGAGAAGALEDFRRSIHPDDQPSLAGE